MNLELRVKTRLVLHVELQLFTAGKYQFICKCFRFQRLLSLFVQCGFGQ